MKLTEVQRSIVEAPLGPAIVTAGAGSGKTRVLTHRIAHLVNEGLVPRDAVLALTFTNKAAGEMKNRVEDMIGLPRYLPSFIGTFHAWCARMLRKYIKEPFTKNFTIYDTNDSKKVINEICKSLDINPKDDEAVNSPEVQEEYKTRLEQNNALDFDDLLEKMLALLQGDSELCRQIQDSIRYVLVDEFQDTNEIQYKIVRILAEKHKNIMVVGDEDQCIYTWRGATIENLNAFRRDFPDAKIYKLEENFRSSKNIVNIANKLVAENYNRIDKVLFSHLPDGKIEIKQCYDEREEARHIAMTIATAHHRDRASYRDFAVLMRLNATSRSLEEQFRAFNIPHIIWGGFKFYERAEIKSVINYLRVLINPFDQVAVADALNFPKRGIGDVSVKKILAGDIEGLSAKAKQGYDNYLYVLNNLREIHDNFGLHDLAASLISTIGIDQTYKTGKEEDLNRLENLYQLEQAIKSFAESNPTATLSGYLQSVSLVQDTDSGNKDDSVIISTVHSAKGLEFKNVFVIGLEDGLFPLHRAKQSSSEMEEERRLLYVALTRARRGLYLSYCMSRFYQGDRRYSRPSQFLEECGFDTEPAKPRWQDFDNDYTPQCGGVNFAKLHYKPQVKPRHSDEWLDD